MRHRHIARRVALATLALTIAVPVAASAAVKLQTLLTGLSRPVFVTAAPDTSNRLFIVEQGGLIKVLQPGATAPTVFLGVRTLVATKGGEEGLLGDAFHPD